MVAELSHRTNRAFFRDYGRPAADFVHRAPVSDGVRDA